MTSPYLRDLPPLRSYETALRERQRVRRRAVELTRERGWEWEQLTPAQQDRMLAHAEQETRGGEG